MAVSSSHDNVPWPINKDEYDLRDVIGYGATAVVQAAYCKARNEMCAIKRVSLESTNQDELLKEVLAMSQCKHPNVVYYYRAFVVKTEVWLVMKLFGRGSVLDIIKNKIEKNEYLTGVLEETVIATILREVLKGLDYLHKNGQIHRDLKAGNILLGDDGTVMLADLGVSSWTGGMMSREKSRHTFVGTPCWMAPEVMEQAASGYDIKADIWSFGITAIELATGKAPYHQFPAMKVLMLTLQNDPPDLDTGVNKNISTKKYTKPFRKMIETCLQRDPDKRPNASQLLKDPFFKKAKGKEYLIEHLLASAPLLKDRGIKPKRVPGSSGRLRKQADGGWEWSDDEYDDNEKDENQQTTRAVPTTSSNNNTTTNSVNNQMHDLTLADNRSSSNSSLSVSSQGDGGSPSPQQAARRGSVQRKNSVQSGNGTPPVILKVPKCINFVLRLRNAQKELNDIKFAYTYGKDTPDGISQELVAANIVQGRDKVIVSASMLKLIEDPTMKPLVFPLHRDSTVSGNAVVSDEKTLHGFAQLSIVSQE